MSECARIIVVCVTAASEDEDAGGKRAGGWDQGCHVKKVLDIMKARICMQIVLAGNFLNRGRTNSKKH